ncbi:hypothetical protein HMPREF3232_01470 [Fannyhessea vaginae]|nr:hypothetical protein HMPREF3232_01470 [Fannyhessea vaginae]
MHNCKRNKLYVIVGSVVVVSRIYCDERKFLIACYQRLTVD